MVLNQQPTALAGAGIELAATAGVALSLELRYQRGFHSLAVLQVLEAKLAGLISAAGATLPAAQRSAAGACSSEITMPAALGVLAMPAECSAEQARQETQEMFRFLTLSLSEDVSVIVARLKSLSRREGA